MLLFSVIYVHVGYKCAIAKEINISLIYYIRFEDEMHYISVYEVYTYVQNSRLQKCQEKRKVCQLEYNSEKNKIKTNEQKMF